MKYRNIADPNRIQSVRVINFFDKDRIPEHLNSTKPRYLMSDFFFLSIFPEEQLGLVEVNKRDSIDKLSFDEKLEYKKLFSWQKNCTKFVNDEQWEDTCANDFKFEDVAKMFWLCDHLAKGGTLEFPMTQAYNRYYNTWETTVGNGRIPALRYFYTKDTIELIRFKTKFCKEEIDWKQTFNSLHDIENYFNHPAVINFRAWGGNLIPGVHFFNRDEYKNCKVEYHNKLVEYFKINNSLNIDTDRSLCFNISNILEKIS